VPTSLPSVTAIIISHLSIAVTLSSKISSDLVTSFSNTHSSFGLNTSIWCELQFSATVSIIVICSLLKIGPANYALINIILNKRLGRQDSNLQFVMVMSHVSRSHHSPLIIRFQALYFSTG